MEKDEPKTTEKDIPMFCEYICTERFTQDCGECELEKKLCHSDTHIWTRKGEIA
jgi:hypothetical protein